MQFSKTAIGIYTTQKMTYCFPVIFMGPTDAIVQ